MLASHAVASPRSDVPDGDRLRRVVGRITDFGPGIAEIAPLPGGLTNHNFRVTDEAGRRVVVRLSDPQTGQLGIDREFEHHCARAAAALGVAPAVRSFQPESNALVVDWIDGRALEPAELADAGVLGHIAAACRGLHAGPLFGRRFDMFDVQRDYLRTALAAGYRLPADYLDFMPLVDDIRAAMVVSPEPIAPCHNDLLAANIVVTGDGTTWLIDFELAGDNEPSFEIGNIWSEASLDPGWLDVLVNAYYGAVSPERVARARLWGLMSKYGWMLWASIQDTSSTVDFDFWSWGLEKYERAVAEFRGPELARLMTDVHDSRSGGDRP